jgi:hypothetical protein
MRRTILILVVLALPGCAFLGTVAAKPVTDKKMPNRLIAEDRSECLVSEKRFTTVEVGMKVLCFWAGGVLPPKPLPPVTSIR